MPAGVIGMPKGAIGVTKNDFLMSGIVDAMTEALGGVTMTVILVPEVRPWSTERAVRVTGMAIRVRELTFGLPGSVVGGAGCAGGGTEEGVRGPGEVVGVTGGRVPGATGANIKAESSGGVAALLVWVSSRGAGPRRSRTGWRRRRAARRLSEKEKPKDTRYASSQARRYRWEDV